MHAELAQLETPGERRSFVLGCVTAVLKQPAAWARLRYPILLAATLTAGVFWSARIGYAPLRFAVLAMMTVLIGLLVVARWKGPVRADRPARWLCAIGVALVAVLLWPPLPVTGSFALLAVFAAVFLAIGHTKGDSAQRLVAALSAGALTSLLIFTLVTAVLLRIPLWVPDIGGAAFPATLTQAQRLQENQEYAVDPYIAVLLIGAILAAALAGIERVLRSSLAKGSFER
jgi:hypothetical protein